MKKSKRKIGILWYEEEEKKNIILSEKWIKSNLFRRGEETIKILDYFLSLIKVNEEHKAFIDKKSFLNHSSKVEKHRKRN